MKLFRLCLIIVSFFSCLLGEWEIINNPDNQSINKLISDGYNLYAGTTFAEVFISHNEGDSWSILAEGLNTFPYGTDMLHKKDDYIFFSQNIGSDQYNYRSYNNGVFWEQWELLPYQSSALTEMFSNQNYLYTIIDGSISSSLDYGSTWNSLNDPPIDGYIKLLYVTDQYLYVSHGCEVFRTADHGQTWEDITSILNQIGPPDPYSCSTVLEMNYFDEYLIISMYWGGGVGTLFSSLDEGSSWSLIENFPSESNSDMGQNNVTAIASKDDVLYLGTATSSDGIYYTDDFLEWFDYSDGLSSYDLSVSSFAITENYIFKLGGTINAFRNHLIEIELILGDINSDGIINIHDIITLINLILGDDFDTSADINNDGELDVLDVIFLVNIILYY